MRTFTLLLVLTTAAVAIDAHAEDSDKVLLDNAIEATRTKQFDKARELVFPLAEKGDAAAQFLLGGLNECTDGRRKDEVEMYDMYFRAARNGVPQARRRLVEWLVHDGFTMKPRAPIGYTYRRYVDNPTPEAIDFQARAICHGTLTMNPCKCFGENIRKTMWTIISAGLGNTRARLVATFRPWFYSNYHYEVAEGLAHSYQSGELSGWIRQEYEAVLEQENQLERDPTKR